MNEPQIAALPLSSIQVMQSFNPRRHFVEGELQSLADSIKAQGVLQPITVRPAGSNGGYELVAGERRWRAAQRAGLDAIPAYVRTMSDQEALAAAIAENCERADLSVAEEARVAKRVVALCDGDLDEAARRVGWTRRRVEARMALLHATDEVLDALETDQIKVGHAELLATIPPETQVGTLRKVLDRNIGVADLKQRLGEFARELVAARFNTDGCRGCPFNSSTQASLFEFSVGEGRCANHTCWNDKTTAFVETVKIEKAKEFPVVWLDRDKDHTLRTPLVQDGPRGVGAAQFAACKGCKDYGALISTEPGREGAVIEGVCFNLQCNAEKVAAHAEAQRQEQAPVAPEQPRDDAKAGVPAATGGATPAKPKAKPDTAGSPRKVMDAIDEFVRTVGATEVQKLPELRDALSLHALFALTPHDMADKVAAQLKGGATASDKGCGRHEGRWDWRLLRVLVQAGADQRERLRAALCQSIIGFGGTEYEGAGVTGSRLMLTRATVQLTAPDLTGRFVLDERFLRAHTKSGIAALMTEAGFTAWYDEKNQSGAFDKLMKQKVDDIVTAILGAGFDFREFVPKAVYDSLACVRAEAEPAAATT